MPNHGRSGRCRTCKRRRVKCDEGRPTCSQCRRLGLSCAGYGKDYTFKDESQKFISASKVRIRGEQVALVQCSASGALPSRSLLTEADVAVPFFLVHYAGIGRRLAAARGFFESLTPMYTSQPCDSSLSHAVSAVAARVFSLWRHENSNQVEAHSMLYAQAIECLRLTLERPEDRRRPATALAVLALHLYESISAMYDARQAMPAHHYGALSLLPMAALDSSDAHVSKYVKSYVLHTEISSALRQRRSIHPNANTFVSSLHTSSFVPGNLSSILDSIGVSVAELQADFVRELSRRHASSSSLEQNCRALITRACHINELLCSWARDTPIYWRPFRLTSVRDFDPSIAAYLSACDIYPSCQIATLWNLWRFHRLLLLKVIIRITQLISNLSQDMSTGDERLMSTTTGSAIQAGSVQELVDSICYSVPFYLGNRTKQFSLSDFTDPGILFPSYHPLTSGNARIARWYQNCDEIALSRDEHHRHMIAYGAWHILSPLSNLLTMFSDNHGGPLVAACLRLNQQEWIRGQFLRVSTLIRLPTVEPFSKEKGYSPSLLPINLRSAENAAENLAEQVRKGAIFMSGP